MTSKHATSLILGITLWVANPGDGVAQHIGHGPAGAADTAKEAGPRGIEAARTEDGGERSPEMFMLDLGSNWSLMAMAQAFPIGTWGAPFAEDSPLHDHELYLTQPAVMANLESYGSQFVLRTTLNFEGETQRGGEYTFGGWGEGFIDKRHPHTLLHELMLSYNAWDAPGGSFSVSAGKGFAPYGTDDPMSRPVLKYPTNHHLSQILERWTLNGVYLHRSGLSLEAGIFGGAEPQSPYDLSNIESFGDSWSARVAQRFGEGFGPLAPWEISASYGRVEESHGTEKEVTHLVNGAVRHEGEYGFGHLYALGEASRSNPEGAEQGYYALLGETRLELGRGRRHQPYYRIEYATRPEYHREGELGSDEFYLYDHDDGHTDGATRWLIHSVGYGYDLTGLPFSARPFVELQHNQVWQERGSADPVTLFGNDSFWSLSAGFRIFLGGNAMRMGSYGVLDPMSASMRQGQGTGHGVGAHQGH